MAGRLPPWVIAPLLLPWAICGAYTTTAMAFLLSNAGVCTLMVASFLAYGMIPDTSKVLWAPLVDTTLGPRRWHAIGVGGTIVTLLALGVIPVGRSSLPLITVIAVLSAFAATFVHLSTDVILAYDVADDRKGRAAGWNSATNLGGNALGGALAIFLSQQHAAPPWTAAVAMAALCAVGGLFVILAAPRPGLVKPSGDRTGLKALGRDLWSMVRSSRGGKALFLVLLPIGSIDMLNLLPAIAKDWSAHAAEVVFVTGVGGGVLQAFGAMVGGVLSDLIDRKLAYCLTGLGIALVVALMAIAPRTPLTYIVFGSTYLTLVGVLFATLVAVEFEAVGKGSAATKCMLVICTANLSSTLFSLVDGWLHDRLGVKTMLLTSSPVGAVSVAIFGLVALLRSDVHATTFSRIAQGQARSP